MAIKIMAPNMLDRVPNSIRTESPSKLSIVSISFEKRFMMRPRGVVSKNDMGACITRSMARWSRTELVLRSKCFPQQETHSMKVSRCVVDEQGKEGTHKRESEGLADTESRIYSHLNKYLGSAPEVDAIQYLHRILRGVATS